MISCFRPAIYLVIIPLTNCLLKNNSVPDTIAGLDIQRVKAVSTVMSSHSAEVTEGTQQSWE